MPDTSWLSVLLSLALGFTLLWWGASWLVDGAARLARGLGVSTLVVGLTVVAWGTSAPEVMVTLTAATGGTADLGLGNILGSNIANIGLVLGSCALVLPTILHGRLAARETAWLFVSLGVLWWVCSDWAVTRGDAALLLAAFAAHNLHLWRTSSAAITAEDRGFGPMDFVRVVAGAGAIYFGCEFAVDGAVAGAAKVGVSDLVIGLTVVAVGTSLPEFAAGHRSAWVGESDISLGNVVGSNVFNLLAVLGVVGLVYPIGDPSLAAAGVEPAVGSIERSFRDALSKEFVVVLVFSVALVAVTWIAPGRGGRWKGLLLVGGWVGYTLSLFVQ